MLNPPLLHISKERWLAVLKDCQNRLGESLAIMEPYKLCMTPVKVRLPLAWHCWVVCMLANAAYEEVVACCKQLCNIPAADEGCCCSKPCQVVVDAYQHHHQSS